MNQKLIPLALRILAQITRQICRLDVSHNLLGPEGTLILIQGLNSLRGQFSSSDFGIWGLTEINLGHNGITDAAVDALLGYAKKDVMLRKIYLQGNTIEVSLFWTGSDHIAAKVTAQNQYRLIRELSKLLSTRNAVFDG